MLNRILLLFLWIIFPCNKIIGQDIQYGLSFKSYEMVKENRTGLNLTPQKPFRFKNGFTISFEVCFNSSWIHPFGSVVRIIANEEHHIDLILSEVDNSGKVMISIVSSSHNISFNKTFDNEISYDQFFPVEISIDIPNEQVKARIGNEEFIKQSSTLDSFSQVSILFGKSNYPKYQTTDVPSFILKNLRIYDAKNSLRYSWPLSKHAHNGVYDDICDHFASSENAEWVQDYHAIWQKKVSLETGINPQFCYNPDKGEVAVLDKNKFYRYNLQTGTMEEDSLKHTLQYMSSNSNNLIYNPATGEYNCPVFELEKGLDIYRFDSLSREWNKSLISFDPPEYWHHNRFFSHIDSCLYLFFGYGHHQYKNEINRYDYGKQIWEKLSFKNDRIPPRYLGGLGQLDSQHLLLFGGYGSETGNQSVSPRSFYDLYKINIRTLEAKKLWELESPQEEFVVGNSIVTDVEDGVFYALTFPFQQFYTTLTLMKFSIDQPQYTVVADSIPFHFEDVKSNADLYLDKLSNQLIAVIVSPQTESKSTLSIYTLSYPPLAIHDLYQNETEYTSSFLSITNKILILLFITAIIVGWLFILYRRKVKGKPRPAEKLLQPNETPEPLLIDETSRHPSVNLLGGFQVFDKNGEDVTKEFTPTLKQLFVLLFLYTAKNGKGISSAKLKDILWYDKSDESSKNNRGVFLNKLRQTFELIGPIHIKNKSLYWSLELDETIYCDYTHMLALMNKLEKAVEQAGMNDIQQLLRIMSKGELLPNIQTDWIDSFKSDFSNQLIDLLLMLFKNSCIRKSPATCILLADSIFIHDPLNEDALSIKCSNLVQMGKYGLAQKVYTSFTKEYRSLFDSDFASTFEQVIKHS